MIFIGDIHGMHKPLLYVLAALWRLSNELRNCLPVCRDLLEKVHFDTAHDTLVHAGDIIVKGPHSQRVLQELIQMGALGVRGNQDQKVVEWRGWIQWVLEQEGGKAWLAEMEKQADNLVSRFNV